MLFGGPSKIGLPFLGLLLTVIGASSNLIAADTATTQAQSSFSAGGFQSFLAKNCFACHGEKKQSGDLNLQSMNAEKSLSDKRDLWEEVLRRIETGEMPPKQQPRPDEAELKSVVQWLENQFDGLDKLTRSGPIQVTARRLNRTEYDNTVRELLGVDLHVGEEFPPDDSGYGFDNIGDVLSMSSQLMEKYVKAAEKVARTALYGVELPKPIAVIHQPWYIDFDTTKEVKTVYDETGISMPYSSHAMHRVPVDGEYEITGWLRGFRPSGSDPIRVGFWIDGEMVQEGQVTVPSGGELNGLSTTIKVPMKAGEHWLAVTVLKIYEGLPAAYKGSNPSKSDARAGRSPTEFFTQNIRIFGPISQVGGPSELSRQKIFTCGHKAGEHHPECTKVIVNDLARRAYRRPATEREIDDLLRLVKLAQDHGDPFEEGLCLAIQKLLVSPHFLFRIDAQSSSGEPRPLTAHEFATRLSYFLWSSMPDESLMKCADDQTLFDPDILERQVRRMLQDGKSFALVDNFGGQWLQFRALESHTVERKKFQQYTDYTVMSMRKETELFFNHIIQEDRSIFDFLSADYTFLNQRLAEYYGIPGVEGHEFRKVKLPAESHRGGVATQASILTVSSYATRTSPVLRGKWILETLLNAPPPPPPPDIPSLDDDKIGTQESLREQLAKHRENALCASCHAKMDPLGFALDNFNAIGMWRDKDGKFPIDATGELSDGRKIDGPDELKLYLASEKLAFAACIGDKMLTYALGRGLKRSDRSTVKSIAERLTAENDRFSSLVLAIVNSPQFQMRDLPSQP